MLPASPRAHAPSHHFQNDPRSARIAAEFRKLVAAARNYLSSRNRLFRLGDDPLVQQLVSSSGFKEFDAYVQRVGAQGRMVTVLCIPTRIWRDPESRRRLLEIKRDAKALRTSCILVPQRWIKAETRASVARVLSAARNTRYTRRQMTDVLGHLQEMRISTLIETASAMSDHDDPVGAVLAMACEGLVDIDRTSRIDAHTWAAMAFWTPNAAASGEAAR